MNINIEDRDGKSRRILEATRKTVRHQQACYSEQDFRKDRLKWLVHFQSGCYQQFKAQRILLHRGTVVWGAIIQANDALFRSGSCMDPALPAAIIYSDNPIFDAKPWMLHSFAQKMFDLKGKRVSREMQKFANRIGGEVAFDVKLEIPTGFTEGIQCYYSTLMIARKHLPGKYLAEDFFPILMLPNETKAVTVLPSRYWDSELVATW